MIDLNNILAAAIASSALPFAIPEDYDEDRKYSEAESAWLRFVGRATPTAVLEMISLIRKQEEALKSINAAPVVIDLLPPSEAVKIEPGESAYGIKNTGAHAIYFEAPSAPAEQAEINAALYCADTEDTARFAAQQGDGELPPLPMGERLQTAEHRWDERFTSDQMYSYARAYGEQQWTAGRRDQYEVALQQRDRADKAEMELDAALAQRAVSGEAKPAVQQHTDDIAWDKFAAAGKAKMAEKRGEGRGGWNDPEQCLVQDLATMLVEHVAKGDPVDIGDFCMMIWNRMQSGYPLGEFDIITAWINCSPPKQPDSERDAARLKCIGTLTTGDIEGDEIGDWGVEFFRKEIDAMEETQLPNRTYGLYFGPVPVATPQTREG